MNEEITLLENALKSLEGYRRNHNDHQPCDAEKDIITYLKKYYESNSNERTFTWGVCLP